MNNIEVKQQEEHGVDHCCHCPVGSKDGPSVLCEPISDEQRQAEDFIEQELDNIKRLLLFCRPEWNSALIFAIRNRWNQLSWTATDPMHEANQPWDMKRKIADREVTEKCRVVGRPRYIKLKD